MYAVFRLRHDVLGLVFGLKHEVLTWLSNFTQRHNLMKHALVDHGGLLQMHAETIVDHGGHLEKYAGHLNDQAGRIDSVVERLDFLGQMMDNKDARDETMSNRVNENLVIMAGRMEQLENENKAQRIAAVLMIIALADMFPRVKVAFKLRADALAKDDFVAHLSAILQCILADTVDTTNAHLHHRGLIPSHPVNGQATSPVPQMAYHGTHGPQMPPQTPPQPALTTPATPVTDTPRGKGWYIVK
jgi:hypothetical protein